MLDMRSLITARHKHRYANTYPWRKLNALLTIIFDVADYFGALTGSVFGRSQGSPTGQRALHYFRRIVHRRVADIELKDGFASSTDPRKTLLRLSSIYALKRLYPYVNNVYCLRFFDFLYLQYAECRQGLLGDRPIIEIVWNEPKLFEEVCCLPGSCIIVTLHNGFAHCTRAISFSEKNLAAVFLYPKHSREFYRTNKVNQPNDIEIIPVNRETLLTLTKVAKNNKAMICTPDAVCQETGKYEILSLGMFQLARYINVPLYFVDFCMDQNFVLRGFIKGPVDCSAGPVKAAEEFNSFCELISSRTLKIIDKRWDKDSNRRYR
jgi:hypothetical protein